MIDGLSARRYFINPDICVAETLWARFYHDVETYELSKQRIFERTWQWIGGLDDVASENSMSPREIVPGLLNLPVLMVRNGKNKLQCLSNVCTHRGNILVRTACSQTQIVCAYHARCFNLDGHMIGVPEFGEARRLPTGDDNLARVPFARWGDLAFASLKPAAAFDAFFGHAMARLAWLPLGQFKFDPARSRDYVVNAHWALYVENYLEESQVPFVAEGSKRSLDRTKYGHEIYRYSSLRLALATPGAQAFDIPESSPDHGVAVAAYYWWIFPNLMLNFYPWGLSLAVVQPEAIDRTRVLSRAFVWDASKLPSGAGDALDQSEAGNKAVVEAVQRGTRSPLYKRGRYSPTRERGMHHFHRLLCDFLSDEYMRKGVALDAF